MKTYPFIDEEGFEYGRFEVFRSEAFDCKWYWWKIGSDDDPVGPFDSEQQAISNARGYKSYDLT